MAFPDSSGQDSTAQPAIDDGMEFFLASSAQQDACAMESAFSLAQLGQSVQHLIAQTGHLMRLADGFVSCAWGCHGREHVFEDIVARVQSHARAASRLIGFGQYDEALALIRSIAEFGNLIWLFFSDPSHIRSWIDRDPDARKKEYSAYQVRIKLEGLKAIVPHDQDFYSDLCETAVHPNPSVRPQVHNSHRIPTTGGFYQERAFVECSAKLAWTLASVVGPAAKLAIIPGDVAESLVDASVALVEAYAILPEPYSETLGTSDRLMEIYHARLPAGQ